MAIPPFRGADRQPTLFGQEVPLPRTAPFFDELDDVEELDSDDDEAGELDDEDGDEDDD